MIKFNKFNVRNTETNSKSRVHYSLDNRVDGKKCVTIYAKDYSNNLEEMFSESFKDDSDPMTDYFEKGKVVLFEGHDLYQVARNHVESL